MSKHSGAQIREKEHFVTTERQERTAEERERVKAIFTFLKGMAELKTTSVLDIDKQPWKKYMAQIPQDDEYVRLFDRDAAKETSENEAVPEERILTVRRPDLSACPAPDEHLLAVQELFLELRRLSKELEQESETRELMIGNGILTDAGNPALRHPILLKRVRMVFDAGRNEVAVLDTEGEPELYTAVLGASPSVIHTAVSAVQGTLAREGIHPLDRTAGEAFLRDTVQLLSSKGVFLQRGQTMPPEVKDRVLLQDNPVFFVRRRTDGLAKFADGVLAHMDATGYVPQTLWAIAGLHEERTPEDSPVQEAEERLAQLSGEDPGILLAMPANREQLAIAQQIERHDAVIVQGPPGTGKTHTIANLMGHFLAQGRRVLVTSHTKKALSVLRDKMSEQMRSLCIALLDETNSDMERSVNGISSYLSGHSAAELRLAKEAALTQRADIMQRLADVRKKILRRAHREHENLVFGRESVSPVEAARYVNEHEARFAPVIPGRVYVGRDLPLSPEELTALYRSNGTLSAAEEHELALAVPDPKTLIAPEELARLRTRKESLEISLHAMAEGVGGTIVQSGDLIYLLRAQQRIPLARVAKSLLGELRKYPDDFGGLGAWHIHAVADGRRGGAYRERWNRLCGQIEKTAFIAERFAETAFGRTVTISDAADRSELRRVLPQMEALYLRDGKIGFFRRLFDKSYQRVEGWTDINGAPIGSAEDCTLVMSALTLMEQREKCAHFWDALLAEHGEKTFGQLDEREPERTAQTILPHIRRCLDWYDRDYARLTGLMRRMALSAEDVFPQKGAMRDAERVERILTGVHEFLPQFCDILEVYGEYCAAVDALRAAEAEIAPLRRSRSECARALARAFFGEGAQSYADMYRNLAMLHEKYDIRAVRAEALRKLRAAAPGWAAAIRARTGMHGAAEPPADIAEAWRWKQYDTMLKELMKDAPDVLARQNTELGRDYRTKTEEAAVCSAWEHMLRRAERDRRMQQNLEFWRLTLQDLGTGSGKRASVLRVQARELMDRCREAVPAWIMTIRTALEQLDPKEHHFDVIIVDEASQADLSALALLYLGTKIIIVGDNKQVSPLAVGQNLDEVGKLIEMHLAGRIPGAQNYTGQTSLYDVGMTICDVLMLREHFRCVPDIIGFSDMLCYGGNIRPLRDAADSALLPAIVPCRMNGVRDDRKGINRQEAEYTVALIRAMTEMPAYRDKTIGVISLLGSDQAALVLDLLLRASVDVERHAILCGNAAQFQGDERDVIILNMVDSAEEDGMLRLMRESKIVQRYNVAVSRARDQLWILHSFPVTALKSDDVRSKLLRYAENPHAAKNALSQIERKADSPFAAAVAKDLVGHGYDIVQQWEIGRYRIDIVVRDGAKKIALECDGDLDHTEAAQVYADMERQMTLERLGWQFIRLRGSAYYRNPKGTMAAVRRKLEAHDIHPAARTGTSAGSDLVKEVQRRAEKYLQEKEA